MKVVMPLKTNKQSLNYVFDSINSEVRLKSLLSVILPELKRDELIQYPDERSLYNRNVPMWVLKTFSNRWKVDETKSLLLHLGNKRTVKQIVTVFFFFFRSFINIYSGHMSDIIEINLVWFYGISTIVSCLMPNPYYTYKQFFFKQSF